MKQLFAGARARVILPKSSLIVTLVTISKSRRSRSSECAPRVQYAIRRVSPKSLLDTGRYCQRGGEARRRGIDPERRSSRVLSNAIGTAFHAAGWYCADTPNARMHPYQINPTKCSYFYLPLSTTEFAPQASITRMRILSRACLMCIQSRSWKWESEQTNKKTQRDNFPPGLHMRLSPHPRHSRALRERNRLLRLIHRRARARGWYIKQTCPSRESSSAAISLPNSFSPAFILFLEKFHQLLICAQAGWRS